MPEITLDAYRAMVGQEVGVSRWLKEVVDRGPKEIMAKTQATVEIEGGEKPALVADMLGLTRFA